MCDAVRPDAKPSVIRISMEPTFVALGPAHAALGMNNHVFYHSIASSACPLIAEQARVDALKALEAACATEDLAAIDAALLHCAEVGLPDDADGTKTAAARRGFAGFAVFVAAVRRAVAVFCCRRPVRSPPQRCCRRCAPGHVVICCTKLLAFLCSACKRERDAQCRALLQSYSTYMLLVFNSTFSQEHALFCWRMVDWSKSLDRASDHLRDAYNGMDPERKTSGTASSKLRPFDK